MKSASLSELKKELGALEHKQLIDVCLRLAKYKKENKELLTYILLESSSEELYIQDVKDEVAALFEEFEGLNLYLTKKKLRKILRLLNAQIKYSGKDTTAVELLLHYCSKMKQLPMVWYTNTVLVNLYNQQLKRIEKSMDKLHEDLQYDFRKEYDALLIRD
jgi:hypothetical protein